MFFDPDDAVPDDDEDVSPWGPMGEGEADEADDDDDED